MSYYSGYKLDLYCDCEECRNGHFWKQENSEYFGESKTQCFKDARADGWTITKDLKCYAKGHKRKKAKK